MADITREFLEKHRAQLEARADKLRADLNAVAGAIQNTTILLEHLEKPAPAEASSPA